jgi:pimeloyl-ACP methyl ester carboxylesterase
MKHAAAGRDRGFAARWFIGAIVLLIALFIASAYHADIPVDELKAEFTNAESQFIDILGMPVHYRDEGSGPLLVLIHGTAASLHTWDGWVDALRNEFRIVRMDIPAFGLTGPDPTGDYSIDRYVEFLEAFASALHLEHFALAGNSLGGEIAWRYALAYPERVNRLVLVDAVGYSRSEGQKENLAFRLARTAGFKTVMSRITPRFLYKQGLLEVYGDDSKVTEELVDHYFRLSLREGNRRAFAERVVAAQGPIKGDVRDITQPTLILWGEDDLWIPLEHGRNFARDIEGSQLIVYAGVGHVPMEEAPEQSATDTRAFLLATQTGGAAAEAN